MINWPLLLAALTMVETGGHADPSNAVGDNGRALGPLQIHKAYVEDVNRINGPDCYQYKLSDRKFTSCSRGMTVAYLRYWGKQYTKRSGYKPTYEVYARIQNGGPKGPFKESTLTYWQKVRSAMDQIRKDDEQ